MQTIPKIIANLVFSILLTSTSMATASGRKQSELIRDALDRFLQEEGQSRRMASLREAAGLWKDRDDLPDFQDVRNGWDRG